MGLVVDHSFLANQIPDFGIVTLKQIENINNIPSDLEGVCFIGSGGKFSLVSEFPLQTGGRFSVHATKPNTADYVDEIQTAFGVTNSQLAAMCGTTRKTLHSWKSGTVEVRKSNAKRLFELLRVSRAWKEAGFTPLGSKEEGASLLEASVLDFLCEDEIDFEKVIFAGSRASFLKNDESLIDPFS